MSCAAFGFYFAISWGMSSFGATQLSAMRFAFVSVFALTLLTLLHFRRRTVAAFAWYVVSATPWMLYGALGKRGQTGSDAADWDNLVTLNLLVGCFGLLVHAIFFCYNAAQGKPAASKHVPMER
jgi:hypothetical protein